jgi:hypothetical protein
MSYQFDQVGRVINLKAATDQGVIEFIGPIPVMNGCHLGSGGVSRLQVPNIIADE